MAGALFRIAVRGHPGETAEPGRYKRLCAGED
jgi:hypothetical protein